MLTLVSLSSTDNHYFPSKVIVSDALLFYFMPFIDNSCYVKAASLANLQCAFVKTKAHICYVVIAKLISANVFAE